MRWWWIALFVGLLPGIGWAAPLTIQADHLDVWHDKHRARFTGHVHLTRADFVLDCDVLRVRYARNGEIETAIATGHVHMRQGGRRGQADRVRLDNRNQRLVLEGHAVMNQPGGTVRGDVIIHDLRRKTTEVHRRGHSGQVRLRIDTDQAPATP